MIFDKCLVVQRTITEAILMLVIYTVMVYLFISDSLFTFCKKLKLINEGIFRRKEKDSGKRLKNCCLIYMVVYYLTEE